MLVSPAHAQAIQVFDIPSRDAVTQRVLLMTPSAPAKAAIMLFTGGNGALQIRPDGEFGSGKGNFLIRMRQQWTDKGFVVALIDAPSDRQQEPFLSGFRQTHQHVADVKATIAWLRERTKLPVWLIGTSRGTQSVAHLAANLPGSDGPDGIVLTSSILNDPKSRSLPAMALDKVRIPTLVVHHAQDACFICDPKALPALMDKLDHTPRKELIVVDGGITRGDPCEAYAYHGYNGIENEVVGRIADWILATH